jgi:hypothetical protein
VAVPLELIEVPPLCSATTDGRLFNKSSVRTKPDFAISSESRLVIGLIETSFGEIARRDPVTTTSCKAVSFAAAGAVCACAGTTADAAAAANTARTAYCSLVFPILLSLR